MSVQDSNDFNLNKDIVFGQKKHGSVEMRNLDELYQNISVVGGQSIKGSDRYDTHLSQSVNADKRQRLSSIENNIVSSLENKSLDMRNSLNLNSVQFKNQRLVQQQINYQDQLITKKIPTPNQNSSQNQLQAFSGQLQNSLTMQQQESLFKNQNILNSSPACQETTNMKLGQLNKHAAFNPISIESGNIQGLGASMTNRNQTKPFQVRGNLNQSHNLSYDLQSTLNHGMMQAQQIQFSNVNGVQMRVQRPHNTNNVKSETQRNIQRMQLLKRNSQKNLQNKD